MSSRVFWGFLLVLIGGLLLASNFGIVSWGVWNTLLRAWPVLVILWGVSVLLRPMGKPGGLITAGVAILAVALVLGYAMTHAPRTPVLSSVPVEQALGATTTRADVEVDFGAGVLNIDGAAPEGQLATGNLEYLVTRPTVRHTAANELSTLTVSMTGGPFTWPNTAKTPTWILHLSPVPEYRVNLEVGACQTRLDLSNLKVRDLNLSTGASDSTIIFGDPGFDSTVTLDFGAASVTVRVPRSVGVVVNMSTGLVGNNLAQAGFTKAGQVWTSSDYGSRTSHLEIRSSGGVSSFTLEWID